MRRKIYQMIQKSDFACPCCGRNEMDEETIWMLDKAMELAGFRFKINSGFRCLKHNAEISGASKTSSHLKGLAADIATPDNWQRFRIVWALLLVGFERINLKIKQCVFKDIKIGDKFMYHNRKLEKINDGKAIGIGTGHEYSFTGNVWILVGGTFLHTDNDPEKPKEIMWMD